jgi:hypothetical protein
MHPTTSILSLFQNISLLRNLIIRDSIEQFGYWSEHFGYWSEHHVTNSPIEDKTIGGREVPNTCGIFIQTSWNDLAGTTPLSNLICFVTSKQGVNICHLSAYKKQQMHRHTTLRAIDLTTVWQPPVQDSKDLVYCNQWALSHHWTDSQTQMTSNVHRRGKNNIPDTMISTS